MSTIALVMTLSFAGFPVAADRVDLDGDGVAEVLAAQAFVEDSDADGLLEIGHYEGPLLTFRSDAGADRPASPCGKLREIWNTGNDLNNVWGTAGGDFDGDKKGDILSMNWPTPTMRVYETDGDNSFKLVFTTPSAHAPPGAYVTVTGGDSDKDGHGEIIGGETSTLNQVFLYESTGDNTYTRRDINIKEPDSSGKLSMGKLRIADADADGKREIIFDTSGVQGSKLFIYEHSGQAGENVYTKVYTYSTVSYLFNWNVGDSDNDGKQEIVLGFGGGGGFPVYLRRLENTGDNTFEHKMVQPGGVGLALAPTVADIDQDGKNELVFAGVIAGQGGGLFIYEAIADDTYELAYSEGGFAGNGLASAVDTLQCGEDPVIVIGSHQGQLDVWKYDGQTYERVLKTPITSGGAIRAVGIDSLDGDRKKDLFFSSGGADDRVYVYEATGLPGDMNCDGVVNFGDINPFVLALSDPAAYKKAYPDCDIMNGDINKDGKFDFGDINPFVALLSKR